MDDRVLEQWLRAVAKDLQKLDSEVRDLRRFQSNVEYDKQVQTVLEIMTRLQSNNTSYTNLILAAGYAAFFTFWSSLKGDMPIKLYAISGLLMVLSLMLFIVWEIVKMIWSAISLRSIEAKIASRSSDPDVVDRLQQEINRFERRIGRFWIWFLIPTITFGISSGLCLVGFFVWKLAESMSA
jgi:hypothetical protein